MSFAARALCVCLLGLAAVGLAAVGLAQSPLALREAGWLAPEGRLEALSSEPEVSRAKLYQAALGSDLRDQFASPEALRDALLTGEALFKAPLLLGGQAAKAGLSCHSCHVNGRGNPHFQHPAISGAPGTADTTHSFFSKTLGNQIADPKPIPDLTQPGKVDHAPASGDLEAFITMIVVEEFSGAKAVQEAIGPLATYVRALRVLDAAPEPAMRPRSLPRDLENTRLVATEADKRQRAGQNALAALLLSSVQSQLQTIHERLLPDAHEKERQWVIESSREAGALRQILADGQSPSPTRFMRWQMALNDAPEFAAIEEETLYNRAVLAERLSR